MDAEISFRSTKYLAYEVVNLQLAAVASLIFMASLAAEEGLWAKSQL